MRSCSIEDYRALQNSRITIADIRARYPDDWRAMLEEVGGYISHGTTGELAGKFKTLKSNAEIHCARVEQSRGDPHAIAAAMPHLLRYQLARRALENFYLLSVAKPVSGKVRFSFLNGYILQKLLFRRGFERKPASIGLFRFWWRFNTQKGLLMYFAQKKGIYCFYSRELIRGLAELLMGRNCLEIAAGDGTLSRVLADAGVTIRATDDHSWSDCIAFTSDVERLDAASALDKYQPEAVICCWPPPFNVFERRVFDAPSVGMYVVIGSRKEFGSGDWKAYESAGGFSWERDEHLASLVIPPELENAVFVFRRK